ncbi:hypothetical protein FDO65_12925 [Nakamurella flava]|uniref:Uncharacterized protein n=1 Tax=Nakamurella flava TaxID=2576308 RepID=A0A4U6QEG8_9ACTN|nr:hypothetical protein [Nakamurella flava]TKV58461.1 hypothetical protein FDO65_12925 [Nakamurella flava]
MTALGGLDGAATVVPVDGRGGGRRRPRTPGSNGFTDALSGADGMAEPGPWPADLGGLAAPGEVFPDALSATDPGALPPRVTVPVAIRPVTTGPTAPHAAARRPPAPAPAPTAARRAPARRAPQAPRQNASAARTAPSAPSRYTQDPRAGTGWSSGGTTARDFIRQARDSGRFAAAATPFLPTGTDRQRPPAPRTAGTSGRTADGRTAYGQRRRPNSTLIFVLFVFAVLFLFGSGLAAGIVDLVRSLLDR